MYHSLLGIVLDVMKAVISLWKMGTTMETGLDLPLNANTLGEPSSF